MQIISSECLQALALVPFAALWDGSRYLIQQCTVSMAPSLAVFAASQGRSAAIQGYDKDWVVVCNPEGDVDLQPLEQQALPAIRKAVAAPGANLRLRELTPAEASSTSIMHCTSSAGTLVVMCHGVMGDAAKHDQDGELLLSKGTRLSATKLRQVQEDLRTSAALLYACNAANGRRAAEGLLGLAYSLLYVGACSVVAPMWEPWVSVAVLHCSRVCQKLAVGSALADALQQAALSLIEQGYSPHYWACFVCSGYPFKAA